MNKMLKVCSRGHKFYKSSDCPVCPICWSGFYKKKVQSDFPKTSAPALRALNNAKIYKLAQLQKWTEKDLLALHGMGPKALGILKLALRKRAMKFAANKK